MNEINIHNDAAFRQVVREAGCEAAALATEEPNFDADCLLHVRVGDYKRYAFPVCNFAFFRAALDELRKLGFKGRIFVVSDDQEAAEKILRSIPRTILPVEDPLAVLGLLAKFRYKVISNSTLSLWGALFGESQACVFPAEWPANNAEFIRIGSAAGWILVH
jgi:hypothetical protein